MKGVYKILLLQAKIILYLVEVINVDIQYMHEEILLLIEDKIIVRYFEEKLKGSGILVKKMEMEALYKMKHEKKKKPHIPRLNLRKESSIGSEQISKITPNSSALSFGSSLIL